MKHLTKQEIKSVFDKFWADTTAANTAMYGLADIWEGPAGKNEGKGTLTSNNTVMAIETHRDNIYVMQGGLSSWLKVITPNETRIYELGSMAMLLLGNRHSPYMSMTVLNDYEVIVGYLYLNLRHLFMAPFGIDMATFYKNPFISISNVRISSSSWVTAIRDASQWTILSNSKTSADNCLPCLSKRNLSSSDFSCVDADFASRQPVRLNGYRAPSEDGVLSYSQGVGLAGMSRITPPVMDPLECLNALDGYSAVFNQARVSPVDVGAAGDQVSSKCSTAIYSNAVNSAEYKSLATALHTEYLGKLLDGVNNIQNLIEESQSIVGGIAEFLAGITPHLGDNEFTRRIFNDSAWWAPIWFASNKVKLEELIGTQRNAYSELYFILMDEFISVLVSVASAGKETQSVPGTVGWVLVGKKNVTPTIRGKNNMTYFRFPSSECMSTRKLFSIDARSIDGICGVETRANGILVWGWKYGESSVLKCFFMTNEGVVSEAGEHVLDQNFSPVGGSPMAVSDAGDIWIIRDFYMADFQDIQFIENTVDAGSEMTDLKKSSTVVNYGNINESTLSLGTGRYYDDGLLDAHPGKRGLEDPRATGNRSWGNDGQQYDWVSGYAGYQIQAADFL